MEDHIAQARRIVERITKARPASPAPPDAPSANNYASDQLRPMRDLLTEIASGLKDARSHASVDGPNVNDRHAPLRDETYTLLNNAGEMRTLIIRLAMTEPGFKPTVFIQGLDDQGEAEYKNLANPQNDNVVLSFQSKQIVQLLGRFGAILVGSVTLSDRDRQ